MICGTIFDRRNLGSDYGFLRKNKFKPFEIPRGLVQAYIRNARENGYDNPMSKETFNKIKLIIRRLSRISLDDPYPSLGIELERMSTFSTGALPQMPMPNIQPTAQQPNVSNFLSLRFSFCLFVLFCLNHHLHFFLIPNGHYNKHVTNIYF